MNELIKITESDNGQVVSARELHSFLEVGTDFSNWCKRMFEYGFEQDLDFTPIMEKSTGGRPSIDYALTLDTAKEISMLQRTEKGKQARKYFIECEKKLRGNYELPQTFSEALRLLADTTEQKERAILELSNAQKTIIDNEPKVTFANSVIGSSNSILVREFAKDLCGDGFNIGQNRLYQWFRDNKYLMSDNNPYQNYVDMGLFEVITRSVGSGYETFTTKTTKITGKGQIYFARKIKN